MELLFLGTSAGVPTRTRNMTSIVLNLQQPTMAEMWLFDCGEGTQHQFLRTPYHPGKLNKIFITCAIVANICNVSIDDNVCNVSIFKIVLLFLLLFFNKRVFPLLEPVY